MGLYIGFARTIYSLTLSNLINNILPTFATIALVEVIRHEMIEKTNKDTTLWPDPWKGATRSPQADRC